MNNRYGLDAQYFEKWMDRVRANGFDNWKPEELARELARMSRAASEDILLESEFSHKLIDRLQAAESKLEEIAKQEPVAWNRYDNDLLVGTQHKKPDERRLNVRRYEPLYLSAGAQSNADKVEIDIRMLKFLHGIGMINHCAFGENPTKDSGNFWWRKFLPRLPQ